MSALAQDAGAVTQIYLHPGQIRVLAEPAIVTTVLGSCIAVCLWDPALKIAGINHYLLPHNPIRGANDARYGNTAMELLLAAMIMQGAASERMVAKIFGGACVLQSIAAARNAIGAQNALAARTFLAQQHIRIEAEQTGGPHGRKLLFDAGTGSAWLKEIGA